MSRRLRQAASPHQSQRGQRSHSAGRENTNWLEPPVGGLIASSNPFFFDVHVNRSRAAASAHQGCPRVLTGVRSNLRQATPPTEIAVPGPVVPWWRAGNLQGSFARDGYQSAPPSTARVQSAQNVSPMRGRCPRGQKVGQASGIQSHIVDDPREPSHLLRAASPLVRRHGGQTIACSPPVPQVQRPESPTGESAWRVRLESPRAIRHGRQIAACTPPSPQVPSFHLLRAIRSEEQNTPPPPQVQSSHLLRTKSPLSSRLQRQSGTQSPLRANLGIFLQASVQDNPCNPATKVSPISYALGTELGNCSQALPGPIVTQSSRSSSGEYLVPNQHECSTPPPSAVIDALIPSSLLDEVRRQGGRVESAEEEVPAVEKSDATIPSEDVLDSQEFGEAFPTVFGVTVCGEIVEQSLKRDDDGNKSSDSLESVATHSCRSEVDSLATASTSAGQLSMLGSSASMAGEVAAAASIAKAAETLSRAADELMASVSRRQLCDLHELKPPNADEELAIASDAVAAVLVTPDADSPPSVDREEDFMQQMTYHKSILMKLTNIRRQCIRLEATGVA